MKLNKKEKWAFGSYILQAVLQIVGLILLFTVAIEKRHKDGTIYWEAANWTTFKWFTTDSNVIMLIISIISIVFILLKANGKIKKLPQWLKIVRLIGTAMLVLTMMVIFGFTIGSTFMPQVEMTLKGLYMGSNAFHHVVCPVVAIVAYLLFDDAKDIPLKKTLYSLIPVIAYGIFYMVMAYTHMEGSGFKEGYDWYRFCSFGPIATPFVSIAVIGAFYLFTWLLWLCNRKINIKSLA